MDAKKRSVLVGGAALALLWLLRPNEPPRPAIAAPAASSPAPPPPPVTYQAPLPPPTPGGPIIDAVVLEKTELCEGEENLVTIRAHSPDPKDDVHLHGVVDGIPGMRAPIVARKNRASGVPPVVMVFGRGDARAMAAIPPFTVKDCTAPHSLAITYALSLNTAAEFVFDARITSASSVSPFNATSYFWEFGDGTSATTVEPHVVHDYSKRPQEAVYSNLLVQVTALSADDTLVGRKAIQIRNPEFANLEYAGIVTLVTELTPRFPTITDGRVVQGIRLWHHRPQPVRIDRIRTRRNSLVPNTPPVMGEVPVASVLGTTTIPPSGLSIRLTLDVAADPDVLSVDYILTGKSAEGLPVESTFSVMKPPTPTKEKSTPVEDPQMVAMILKAREVLGKEYVTDEDLMALKNKGVFKEFKPAPPEADPKLPPVYPH